MRGLTAFLVWLFSFWTWKAFFLRWFKTPPFDQARSETPGVEHSSTSEGQHESALATFLSSLPQDTYFFSYSLIEDKFRLFSYAPDGRNEFIGNEAAYREFLAAVASSKVVCPGGIQTSLRGNDCVKNLDEIVGALLSNNNLKNVELSCKHCSALRMAECVSNLLLGNDVIQALELEFPAVVGKQAAEQLANALHKNRALKSLRFWFTSVEDEGMEVLIKPLKGPNSVLEILQFPGITDVQLEHLGVMLATNTSLKELIIWSSEHEKGNIKNLRPGITILKDALCSNRSLEHLDCTLSNSMELKVLLEPLMPLNNNPQANTTLTHLELSYSSIGGIAGVDILVDMLHTNTSLLELTLFELWELTKNDPNAVENTVAILEALKSNKLLKRINFPGCYGVGGYKVLGTIMDMLLENHHLEDINLNNTGLGSSGDVEYVKSALMKRKKMKLWDLVKGMADVRPKSGRVFLCGNPYAGKTTLRKSMKKLSEFQIKKRSRLRDKLRFQREPKVQKSKMINERTQGIEVDNLVCDGIGISIWDMAGQTEYHSFHDLVVPNLSADGSCSLFLLVCNPIERESLKNRSISSIKLEIAYWLRFIASNTRRSWSYRPHVSIVMTHFDYWKNESEFERRIEDLVEELKSQFQEVLEFDAGRKIFKVDGEDVSYARGVFDFIISHLKQLLGRLPKTIKACAQVQCLVTKWNEDASKQPVLQWEEFCNTMCKEVEELNDADEGLAKRKKEFVAISLNDGGHIMYHEEGGFVITNPHWFCHDIMGQFLHYCANVDRGLETISEHGIISIKHVKRILSGVVGGQDDNIFDVILSMMKKLHICFEQDVNNIMIPSTLQVKHQSLNWLANHGSTNLAYVGRRLACKDVLRTMLSLGFFPRLQVFLFKKFQKNNVGDSYQLFQDVIMFICDGIEVIIEFNHDDIDILLRSEQCQDKMLEFLENGIVMHINDLLLNSTLGCPGVILEEHILRPECVQDLIDSKDRKNQFVRVEDLELKVMTNGFNATHNWKKSGHLGIGYNKVKSLLGDKAWKKLLKRRSKDLERYQREILATSSQSDSSICKEEMSHSWTTLIWQIPQKLFTTTRDWPNVHWKEVNGKLDNIDKKLDMYHVEIMTKLDDVLQLEENIMKMQDTLLREVCARIDDVMAFSIRMQELQVPKLAYLTQNGKRELLTRFVPGLMSFQLHLMCESKNGIHKIVDQEGCNVKFGTKETKRFVAMLVWGLRIATILTKIGAHVAAGMGEMIPDFGEGVHLTGLILDTPGLLDEQIPKSILESMPDDVDTRSRITIGDQSNLAQEWLIEFLEPRCKEKSTFYNMFKLKKVVYKGASGKQLAAWVCEKCKTDGIQSGILYND